MLMAMPPWLKYYWTLVGSRRDSMAMINPYSAVFTETFLPKLPSGRVIENYTYGGYQVPRNNHDHDERDNLEAVQLRLVEIKTTRIGQNVKPLHPLTIKPRSLDETPSRYILRLVGLLKTLESLETIPDATKQKVLDTIKEAYTQYKR